MTFTASLHELQRHRRLVALTLLLSIVIALALGFRISPGVPPRLQSRQHPVGVASARMLINTPSSIVADLNPSGSNSLATRAQLLGNLLASTQVRAGIARSAHLTPDQLTVSPLSVGGTVQTPLASSTPQPAAIATLSVNADPLLPLIAVTAHATTPDEAAALANGAVTVLQSYIKTVAAEEGIPAKRQPVITSLGAAQGARKMVGSSPMFGFVAGVLVFVVGCYLVLVLTGARRRMREAAPYAVVAGAQPTVVGPVTAGDGGASAEPLWAYAMRHGHRGPQPAEDAAARAAAESSR